MNKAIFLDQDDTIIKDYHYNVDINKIDFLPGVIDTLKVLQDKGYLLFIITNQSGVARGYYSEDDVHVFHDALLKKLKEQGVDISKIYYCPDLDGDYRKPNIGMFLKAKEEFDLDLDTCIAIGDRSRDLSICEHSKCRGFLINQKENDNRYISLSNFSSLLKEIDL